MAIRMMVLAMLLGLAACAGGSFGSDYSPPASAGCGGGNNRACGGGG